MIYLNAIDKDRNRKVRLKELDYRGCGKSIERLLTLLSFIKSTNAEKKIFVCC